MEMVPLAMVPEDPGDSRVNSLVTVPVDVEAFGVVLLDCRCAATTRDTWLPFEVTLQESPDRSTWATVAGTDARLGAHAEVCCRGTLARRWLRLAVSWRGLAGLARPAETPIEIRIDDADQVLRLTVPPTRVHPGLTLWCSGSLERRIA